ncbi:hypothetical protein JNK13_08940 [bacterium]|nr:hypothetical protein [bacterium]
MALQKDLKEFIKLLNSHKVKYLIVGAHAVAYHGYPRLTGDIDFFIEISSINATRLEAVMKDFGFIGEPFTAEKFMEAHNVFQLGRQPNRIDLITTISGVAFDQAWSSKVKAELDSLPVYFISKELLIQNKKASGRAKDLLDVKELTSS